MPVPVAQQTIQNVGDILGPLLLGQTGVGQPADVTAIVSLTGVFSGVSVSIEGVPLGQPITQGGPSALPPAPAAPQPASANEWVPVLDVWLINGQAQSSPLTGLTSAGGAGSGYAFAVGCGIYQQLRLRLTGNGGGTAIQGGMATVPFPVGSVGPGGGGSGGSVNAQNTTELGRIRVGLSILLEGLGINLQDLTATDIQSIP